MAENFSACGACGAKVSGEGRYCSHCGTALYVTCSRCGRRNGRGRDRCSGCEEPFPTARDEDLQLAEPGDGRPLERRQLTIMFTDLIDSTGLADSMDPEDFRVLIEAHRTIAVSPIARFGGTVARYLGDGMLVLFGYPEAHEDDPERAVRAGLEVAAATAEMNERWVGEGKGRIAVRIGVHTGIVVVGDVLKADVKEIMAVFGNVPSIASRLQALAKPNGVVLSGATKALLPPAILCETRGNTTLKGVRRPVEVFAALKVREGQGDRRVAGRVLPFVNREKELQTIRRCWAAARRGEGRCLTIEGDPGIGKSRLIRAVEERIVTQPSRWLITRTSPYAANTDFFAFSELFRHVLALEASAGNAFARLKRSLERQGLADPEIAIGLAGLLGIEVPEKVKPLQPERARELTLRAITAWLQHEAGRQPLVLVMEDLHWADASTLEAIDRLKDNLVHHPILLIGTTRGATRTSLTGASGERAAADDVTLATASDGGATSTGPVPVTKVEGEARPSKPAQASPAGAASTTVRLERLGAVYAEDLLGHVLQGAKLPKAAVTTLLKRANGVPLYLEELPKPVLEAGGGGGAPVALPATLRDSLMAQLDGMGEAKAVAQTAAVLGHSFERPLLEHVWEHDGDILNEGFDRLTEAELIRSEGKEQTVTYGFRHALLAEIAYDSLLRDERRRIHKKTADILVNHFQRIADTRADILARHHEAAESHEDAFECWMKAGRAAARRFANIEAVEHFKAAERSLAKIRADCGADLDTRWFDLKMSGGPAMVALYGWASPQVELTYRKAWDLALKLGDTSDRKVVALGGLYNHYLLCGDLEKARQTCDQIHQIAVLKDSDGALANWHRWIGYCSFLAAEFDQAEYHMYRSIDLYGQEQASRHTAMTGTHPAVIANAAKAWSQWFLGKATKSKASRTAAIRLAREAGHPFSMCYALCFAASIAQCKTDAAQALRNAEQAMSLAREYSFPYWLGWSGVVRGWAMASLGDPASGLSILNDGLKDYQATGAAQMRGYMLCLASDAHRMAGQFDEAMLAAEQAIQDMNDTGIAFYKAEAYRLFSEVQCSLNRNQGQPLLKLAMALRLAQRQRSPVIQLRVIETMLPMTDRKGLRSIIKRRKERLSASLATELDL